MRLVRAEALRNRRIQRQLELGEDVSEVRVAEVEVQEDIPSQRAGAKASGRRLRVRRGLTVAVGAHVFGLSRATGHVAGRG